VPHEHPDDKGCTGWGCTGWGCTGWGCIGWGCIGWGCIGWGCIGCLVAFAISIAAMLWLIHVALVAGVPYRP